jgi:hypothetical protein
MTEDKAEDSHTPPVTINSLSDEIFREIFREVFTFYLYNPFPNQLGYDDQDDDGLDDGGPLEHAKAWQRLVHVCQRWRNIIFGSPRSLDLHLHCSFETPFRKKFSPWPEFPLTLDYAIYPDEVAVHNNDDFVFAIKHPDRVHRIDLIIGHSDVVAGYVLGVMEVPFPALRHLHLEGPDSNHDEKEFDLPHDFLGGSTPCLQHIHLCSISFPTLPRLLLSARGLRCLELECIPASCYGSISSEEMVGGLSGLTMLRTLSILFDFTDKDLSYYNRPEKRGRPDPPNHATLPALTRFEFKGENEYQEALIAQIDMPQVEVVVFRCLKPNAKTRQLSQFIGRTARLESARFRDAKIIIDAGWAWIELDHTQDECNKVHLSLTVDVEDGYYSVPRLLGQLAATSILSNVDHLSVEMSPYWTEKGDRMETSIWLAFLHLFPAVEALRVRGGIAVNIASTLENIPEESVTEVLPGLRLLRLDNGDEPVGSTERFLALRGLSGCPVTVIDTQDEINE